MKEGKVSTKIAVTAAGLALSLAVAVPARAEYPERPIKIVVPVAAGTVSSIPPRVFGEAMERVLKQPFIIENKPGAGQSVGLDFVARSSPDGYTLGAATPALPNIGVFFKKPPFDVRKDLKMVSILAEGYVVLATNDMAPYSDFKSMVAYAKANPGKMNFGTTGADDPLLFTELIKQKYNLNMVHIPFRGTNETVQAMLAGDVQLGWVAPGRITGGAKLKPLLLTGAARIESLPDVPAATEAGLPEINTQWFGLVVPSATPKAIVDRLYAAIKEVSTWPEVKNAMEKATLKVVASTPDAAQKVLLSQADNAKAVADKAGIKPVM